MNHVDSVNLHEKARSSCCKCLVTFSETEQEWFFSIEESGKSQLAFVARYWGLLLRNSILLLCHVLATPHIVCLERKGHSIRDKQPRLCDMSEHHAKPVCPLRGDKALVLKDSFSAQLAGKQGASLSPWPRCLR